MPVNVVATTPRSRSSLVMRILLALAPGSVAGYKFPAEQRFAEAGVPVPDDEKGRIERARQLNPEGFYELPGVFAHGLPQTKPAGTAKSAAVKSNGHARFDGKIIKMAFTAIGRRETGRGTTGTDASLIGQCLVLRRDPLTIMASQARLIGEEEVATADGQWDTPDRVPSPGPYLMQAGWLCRWLSKQDDATRARFRTLDTDALVANPASGVDAIVEHLSLKPTDKQRQAAIALIDPTVQSAALPGWPEQYAQFEDLATTLHDALGSLDLTKMQAAAFEWESFQHEQMLEQVRWVDADDGWDTWCQITAAGARMIANNVNGVRDHLQQSAQRKRRSKQGSLLPLDCQHYQHAEETYTIERSADLGPLTRPLIACQRDGVNRTLEQCFHCWQRGSLVEGKAIEPQRHRQWAALTKGETDGQ